MYGRGIGKNDAVDVKSRPGILLPACFLLERKVHRRNILSFREGINIIQLIIKFFHISQFFVGKLTQGVQNLAILVFAIAYILGGSHNGHIQLSSAGTNLIPVDKVYMRKLTAVYLAVLDGQSLTASKERGAEMSVGIEAGIIARELNHA